MRLAVRDGAPVEIVDAVSGHFGNAFFPSPPARSAQPCDLRFGGTIAGNDRVIGAEFLERIEHALTAAYQAWWAAVWVNW